MKTAMIWGAGGGIGRALVIQLAGEDWRLVAITHQPTDLADLTPHVIDADVGSPYQVDLAITSASQIVDEVDLWIYAVGDITSSRTADMSVDAWQRIIDANLTGAFLTTHYSLPLLAADAHLVYLGAITLVKIRSSFCCSEFSVANSWVDTKKRVPDEQNVIEAARHATRLRRPGGSDRLPQE